MHTETHVVFTSASPLTQSDPFPGEDAPSVARTRTFYRDDTGHFRAKTSDVRGHTITRVTFDGVMPDDVREDLPEVWRAIRLAMLTTGILRAHAA